MSPDGQELLLAIAYLDRLASHQLGKSKTASMCRTKYWADPVCGHQWISLDRRCGPRHDLINCPKINAGFFPHPSSIPRKGTALDAPNGTPLNHHWLDTDPGWAPPGNCPRCDRDEYDMRKTRMLTKPIKVGTRIGLGASKKRVGVDVPGCLCSVM